MGLKKIIFSATGGTEKVADILIKKDLMSRQRK